jgi:4-hydroxybenzoate polyprenyltransferase
MASLRDLSYFFRLSRPVNIAIAFISFATACFISLDRSSSFLNDPKFWGTAATILLIAATGYWINDVYDFRIDRINKPKRTIVNAFLSVKKVLTFYFILIVAVLAYAFFFLGPEILFLDALAILLLFIYANFLKRISVAGNLVIAFLTSLVMVVGGFLYQINLPLVWAIIFAFEITLLREITKDVEDIRGDLAYNLQTLPIQIGIRSTRIILLVLYIVFIISCYGPFLYRVLLNGVYLYPYLACSILLVQAPAAWLAYRMMHSDAPEAFSFQSRFLKILILSGILSILLIN